MAGQLGVKESAEAIIALLKIGKAIKHVVKDGAQLEDLAALFSKYQTDPVLKAAIDAGIKDLTKAKEEVKELDLQDALALLVMVMPAVQEFVAE